MTSETGDNLSRLYANRFDGNADYRRAVWNVLVPDFFSRFISRDAAVLDLGCGYGEFINAVEARARFAIDMNPSAREKLAAGIQFLLQDCAEPWAGIAENSLDVVFTSNFLEHLPDKAALVKALRQARRCLKPGGRFIALGPNLKYLGGRYWDFWDHQIPLTEMSLAEVLRSEGFTVDVARARFLPYTMAAGPRYPLFLLKIYLHLPLLWRLFGRQFLIVAHK